MQFAVTTSPTDSTFVTKIRKPQFAKGSAVKNYAETGRPLIWLPQGIDFKANEIHDTGTANFEDFSTVGITDGLVGYWPLLDKTTRDLSGSGNHGVNYGATPTDDGFLFVNASSNYINCGSPETLILNEGGTISAFIRLNGWGGASWSNTIFGKGTSGWYGHHYILFKPSGEQCFLLSVSDGSQYIGVSGPRTPTLQLDTWYHIVATWDTQEKKYTQMEFLVSPLIP